MKISTITAILTGATVLVSTASLTQAQSTTLSITEADTATIANFGRTAGIGVTFGSDAPSGNWSAGVPQNGTTYSINSLSVIKNNDNANYENLWVGVYDGFIGNGLAADGGGLGNFLGASTASQAWGAGDTGDVFTWHFSDLSFEAGEGVRLFFVFQNTAGARTQKMLIPEGDIAIQRLDNNVANNIGNFGAAIINGGPTAGAGLQGPRVPLANVYIADISDPGAYVDIPEPSAFAALAGLLVLSVVAVRRRTR